MEQRRKERLRMKSESLSKQREKHATWGEKGIHEGQFRTPQCIRVATDGSVYVADTANHRIQCFSSDGKFICKWGRNGTAEGEFNWPIGLAIGVDDGLNESVMKAMMSISQIQALPPGLLPICVAYVGEEHIVVADQLNHRIQVFKMNGTFVRKWGSHGSTDGRFLYPCSCDIDGHGLVYVADEVNYCIQVFKWDATFVRKWGSQGNRINQFTSISSICVSVTRSLIYIADPDYFRIICCNLDGTGSRQLPAHTSTVSICVDDEDEAIYVCDSEYGIKKLNTINGALIRSWEPRCNGDGQVARYMSVAAGMNKRLYIADPFNHRIIVIKPD